MDYFWSSEAFFAHLIGFWFCKSLFMIKIAVFASGSGTNAENVASYFAAGEKARVTLILSNRPDAPVLERARRLGIRTEIFDRDTFYNSDRVVERLRREGIGYIVLAGFLWLVPDNLLGAYGGRILNVHPSLLPRHGGKGMYGDRVHRAVVESGDRETGITIHRVNEHYDSGDIVARVMPEEWGYHRNGNDRFLPSTAYQNELDDLSIIESRMGGVPLRFDQLATKEDVDSVIVAALAFCKSAANYHEKYEAAFMDMLQCAFTLSEKEAAEGVILDDEAVMERLRSMENIRKMSWTKVLRCVMTASAMSRPILEQVGAIVPLRAQQVVVPVLAVGLCYEVESDVLRMLVYYILSLMSVNSPADSVLRAAFCHYPENYITLMEYYDPAEHGMEAYTRK